MTSYRIVKRAFGTYTDAEIFEGGPLAALERSVELQRVNADGEYLVRGITQPNWEPSSSYQSGMDWL